jgi:hypothetical protein
VLLLYISATRNIVSIFSCVNIYRDDTPFNVVTGHYDVECWTPQYTKLVYGFSLPYLFIWTAGVPMFIFWQIYKRGDSNSFQRQLVHIFLYAYNPKWYYWEMVQIFKKILVVCLLIFGASENPTF